MKVICYLVRGNKEYVAFKDSHCGPGEIKVTDGFHDKLLNVAGGEFADFRKAKKEEINLERIVKRIRGTRPWHPILESLRKELTV